MLSNKTIVISIVITIILIFIITIGMLYYTFSDISNTNISNVNRIYDLLQQVTCELDRNDIKYIITAGTLLGSVRERGMIKWDDDSDICLIPNNDEDIILFKQKVIDCLKVLEKNNIISYEHITGNILISQFRDSGTCLDMFILGGPDNESRFRYLEPFGTKYPNEYYFYNEIFPIKEYNFGPIISYNPYLFLDRTYPNWHDTASKWNHFRQIPKNSSQDTFQPALPDPNNEEFPWIEKECKF